MSTVKTHKRKWFSVRTHKRKDNWPAPKKGAGRAYLMKYRERLVKEQNDFRIGKKVVLSGHGGHPAFIQRRLIQVNRALSQTP